MVFMVGTIDVVATLGTIAKTPDDTDLVVESLETYSFG